jgi:hypothetical protein
MSLRWLSTMVGGRVVPSVRRRVAPQAQRDLASEIDAHALPVLRVWARPLVLGQDGDREPETVVIARIDPGFRTDVMAWLDGNAEPAEPTVRTDWLLFPATPEAILMGAVEGDQPFRFNVRISADRYRRQLEALAETGLLGLTSQPLQVGPERELLSPCRFVPIQTDPLRAFLRELPAPPVV